MPGVAFEATSPYTVVSPPAALTWLVLVPSATAFWPVPVEIVLCPLSKAMVFAPAPTVMLYTPPEVGIAPVAGSAFVT